VLKKYPAHTLKEQNMKWDLTGERINGLYMGLFPYTGTVESSRVKYGGDVQHTVVVDEPFKVYGEVRERILVSVTEVNRILDERDLAYYGA
jgi:hypothetical protein